jgi:large subunit ribosomal protein L9
MKVILLQNVPKIGQKGDVKDLKEGYVRNMLLPRGLAKIATAGELHNLEKTAEANKKYHNAEVARVSEIFKKLDGQIIELSEKTNDKGHLFAKVGKDEIVSAISEQKSLNILPEWFELDPIKEVGEYPVDLKFEKLHKKMVIKIVEGK